MCTEARGSDPLQLELQAVVCCPMSVLGTEFGSSALNH